MSRRESKAHKFRLVLLVCLTGVLFATGCIRNVDPEEKSKTGERPKIAEVPVADKLDAAVKQKNGDVVAGLQVVLGPLEKGKNHTTIALDSKGKIGGVDLSGQAVKADGLKHLVQIKDTLQRLSLNDVYIDEAALEALSQLTNLRKLELNRTPVTDAGLAHLAKLTQLRELSLKGTEITNAGVAHIGGLKELRMLSLSTTKITDDALESVSTLPELNTLLLQETNITNTGLRSLRRLKKLQFLYIVGTKVTASGAALFRRELPGVQVTGP